MTDFANTYVPPGVYIQEDQTPLVSIIGSSPSVVAVVGPSVGFLNFAQNVTLVGTAAVQLDKLGIDPTSVKVYGQDGVLIDPTAYTLTVGGGADGSLTTTPDNTLTIARNGTTLADGTTVYITYQYTDADYGAPHRFRDYDDVKAFYGEPFNALTGAITSPLSFAAGFVFNNLGREVVLIATDSPADVVTRSQLSSALSKLDAIFDVDIVVVLPVGISGSTGTPGDVINVGTDLKAALAASATDRNYRFGLLGFETGVTLDPLDIASGISDKRVAAVWPNALNYYNGLANRTIQVPGYYLAAALAGVLSAGPVQQPLTKKQVAGFTGIPSTVATTMTVTNKNLWSAGGVLVVEGDRNNRLIVRHGVSTDHTNVNTREISLTRSKDAMIDTLDATISAAGLIGSAIDEETPARVKGVVDGCLNTLKQNGAIVDYQNLKVRQQSVDPTVIEVKYEYMPAYPLNYITIVFTVALMTGDVTANA